FHVFQEKGNTYCVSKFYTGELSNEIRQVYMMMIFTMVTVTPCALLVILYAAILLSLARHDRRFVRYRFPNTEESAVYTEKSNTIPLDTPSCASKQDAATYTEAAHSDGDDLDNGTTQSRGAASEPIRQHQNLSLARSNNSLLPRAKIKTLNLSIAIVSAFLL
ncbi:unnamed protein product, partial [Meganyctiphanes norvegica]